MDALMESLSKDVVGMGILLLFAKGLSWNAVECPAPESNSAMQNHCLHCRCVSYHRNGKMTSMLPASFHDNLSKNAQIRQRTLTKSIENSENPLFWQQKPGCTRVRSPEIPPQIIMPIIAADTNRLHTAQCTAAAARRKCSRSCCGCRWKLHGRKRPAHTRSPCASGGGAESCG